MTRAKTPVRRVQRVAPQRTRSTAASPARAEKPRRAPRSAASWFASLSRSSPHRGPKGVAAAALFSLSIVATVGISFGALWLFLPEVASGLAGEIGVLVENAADAFQAATRGL